MKPICVGIVGSGFVAELHMRAYRRVFGLAATVKAVVSRGDHVLAFAKQFGIPETYRDYRELLTDKTISNSKSTKFLGFANQQKSDSGLGCSSCPPFLPA